MNNIVLKKNLPSLESLSGQVRKLEFANQRILTVPVGM